MDHGTSMLYMSAETFYNPMYSFRRAEPQLYEQTGRTHPHLQQLVRWNLQHRIYKKLHDLQTSYKYE